MKINYEKLSVHIGEFIKWYCIFFTAIGLSQPMGPGRNIGWTYYIIPAVASLIWVLFFAPKAIWSLYKKGDKVWGSTYGTEATAKQKVIGTLIFLGIFIFLKVVVIK